MIFHYNRIPDELSVQNRNLIKNFSNQPHNSPSIMPDTLQNYTAHQTYPSTKKKKKRNSPSDWRQPESHAGTEPWRASRGSAAHGRGWQSQRGARGRARVYSAGAAPYIAPVCLQSGVLYCQPCRGISKRNTSDSRSCRASVRLCLRAPHCN